MNAGVMRMKNMTILLKTAVAVARWRRNRAYNWTITVQLASQKNHIGSISELYCQVCAAAV